MERIRNKMDEGERENIIHSEKDFAIIHSVQSEQEIDILNEVMAVAGAGLLNEEKLNDIFDRHNIILVDKLIETKIYLSSEPGGTEEDMVEMAEELAETHLIRFRAGFDSGAGKILIDIAEELGQQK